MNREKAKKLADVLTAYANGADLQYEARNEWTDMKDGDAIVFCIEHGREMRVKQKYNEIFKLKSMLEENHIPFEFIEHNDFRNGYQICYPKGEKCVCSVIEHSFSYGSQNDLLEIQGLMTKEEEEKTHDTVLGYLSAENVFERIKKHYQNQNLNDNNSAKDCQYDDKGELKMTTEIDGKEIELKELTYDDWLNNPVAREMYVWDNRDGSNIQKAFVCGITSDEITRRFGFTANMAMCLSEKDVWNRLGLTFHCCCADIPEIINPKDCVYYGAEETNWEKENCKNCTKYVCDSFKKKEYRPFKDIDELVATWEKMMGYKAKPNTMPLIWVRSNDGTTVCISSFGGNHTVGLSWFNTEAKDIRAMFNNFTFLDGSPFGVCE